MSYAATEGPRLSDTEWAYIAGFIDCGAWIDICPIRKANVTYRTFRLAIGGLNKAQGNWFKERFGDAAKIRSSGGLGSFTANFVTPGTMGALLANASPFLFRFKPYAQLMFRYARTACSPGSRLTPDQIKEREAIEADLMLLRKRGA